MAIFSKKKIDTKKDTPVKTDGQSMKELYAEKAIGKSVSKNAALVKIKPNSQSYRILVKPIVTEKAADFNSLHKYAFVVDNKANKISVMKAIQELYGVKPIKVNIVNNLGKIKGRGRITGKRKDWKKAIVTLPKGTTLDVYEGV